MVFIIAKASQDRTITRICPEYLRVMNIDEISIRRVKVNQVIRDFPTPGRSLIVMLSGGAGGPAGNDHPVR